VVHVLILQVLVGLNKRDPRCFDMYRLNIKSGQLQLDTENPGGLAILLFLVNACSFYA
jgi:hypothetical protein